MVLQKQLVNLEKYKAQLKQKKKAIESVELKIKEMEKGIIKQLKDGEGVEDGKLYALIDKTERVSISWKNVVLEKLGAVYVDKLLKETKPNKIEKLVVSQRV